jgi:hypothetical protein
MELHDHRLIRSLISMLMGLMPGLALQGDDGMESSLLGRFHVQHCFAVSYIEIYCERVHDLLVGLKIGQYDQVSPLH